MMNKSEILRKERVDEIIATLSKCEREGLVVDKKKLILEVMAQYSVARRTALEYVQVAELRLANAK